MNVSKNVFEFPKNNSKDACLYILTDCNVSARNAVIKVLDCESDEAWECQLNDETAQEYYTNFELGPEEYWKDIQEPLQNPSNVYQYWLTQHDFALRRVSKENSKVSFELFRVRTSSISSNDFKMEIITELMQINSRARKQIKELTLQNQELRKGRNAFQKELDQQIAGKVEFEETIFSKFVQLLNAKKQEIVKLEKNIKRASDDSKRQKLESDDDNAYEQDTDVEEQGSDPEVEEMQVDQQINIRDILSL